ncbi:hypothetical protein QL285_051432 [Trifolium repens]|nr:hypothetical protein QL285_051431 [Trifolium repens]KAK2401871.1 hypothetical protein QL285_051432 [Trifolium repens]
MKQDKSFNSFPLVLCSLTLFLSTKIITSQMGTINFLHVKNSLNFRVSKIGESRRLEGLGSLEKWKNWENCRIPFLVLSRSPGELQLAAASPSGGYCMRFSDPDA